MKFHLVEGEYKNKRKLVLPMAAALGGVVVPALIYVFFNYNKPELIKGWAIPIATDTAFVLGVLSFFRRYISLELRAFIIGFSLIDDAVALIIIALFYTKTINILALFISFVIIINLFILNYKQVKHLLYYTIVGVLLWVSMVEAGIHGTLCGAIIALFIPVNIKGQINFLKPHLDYRGKFFISCNISCTIIHTKNHFVFERIYIILYKFGYLFVKTSV